MGIFSLQLCASQIIMYLQKCILRSNSVFKNKLLILQNIVKLSLKFVVHILIIIIEKHHIFQVLVHKTVLVSLKIRKKTQYGRPSLSGPWWSLHGQSHKWIHEDGQQYITSPIYDHHPLSDHLPDLIGPQTQRGIQKEQVFLELLQLLQFSEHSRD